MGKNKKALLSKKISSKTASAAVQSPSGFKNPKTDNAAKLTNNSCQADSTTTNANNGSLPSPATTSKNSKNLKKQVAPVVDTSSSLESSINSDSSSQVDNVNGKPANLSDASSLESSINSDSSASEEETEKNLTKDSKAKNIKSVNSGNINTVPEKDSSSTDTSSEESSDSESQADASSDSELVSNTADSSVSNSGSESESSGLSSGSESDSNSDSEVDHPLKQQPKTKVSNKRPRDSKSDAQSIGSDQNSPANNKRFHSDVQEDSKDESVDPNCIFIKNLPWSIQDAEIYELFGKCGEIKSISWNHRKDNNRFSGTGFVIFSTPEAATKALKLNGKMLGQSGNERPIGVEIKRDRRNFSNSPGNSVAVRNSRPLTPKPNGCTTIYVGNLSKDVNEENITEFFSSCGEIKEVRWVNKNGQFKYCGFIDFKDTQSVDKAVKFNNKPFLGREMRVDYASDERPRNDNFGNRNGGKYSSPFGDKQQNNRNKNFRKF